MTICRHVFVARLVFRPTDYELNKCPELQPFNYSCTLTTWYPIGSFALIALSTQTFITVCHRQNSACLLQHVRHIHVTTASLQCPAVRNCDQLALAVVTFPANVCVTAFSAVLQLSSVSGIFIAVARVQSQVSSCGICGGQSDTGRGFSKYLFSHANSHSRKCSHFCHLSSRAGTRAIYDLSTRDSV
jgi:hypothetical protein